MRKAVVSSLLVLATFVGIAAHADPPKPVPVRPIQPIPVQPVPIPQLNLPPVITDARVSFAPPGTYESGPLKIQIEVHNQSRNALDTSLRLHATTTPIRLDAGRRAWFIVQTDELRKGCAPTNLGVDLVGFPESRRLIVITPSCTFTANFVSPATPSPTQTAGKVWASNFRFFHSMPGEGGSKYGVALATVPGPFTPRCGEKFEGDAMVRNQTNRRVKVGLLFAGVRSEYPDADCRAAGNCPDGRSFLEPGQTQKLRFGGLNFPPYDGRAGHLAVTLDPLDPSTPILHSNARLEIRRTCRLSLELR